MDKNINDVIDSLVQWLRQEVNEAGAKGVIYGLSGGVDSAVVGAIANLAFPENSLGLIMPCYSSIKDERDAQLIANSIGLNILRVDLTGIFDEFIKTTFDSRSDLAKSNLKPRLRMMALYYYGQDLGYLTLGGTNKSEYFIGYFTKYGDGGVDLMPLGEFTKTEVYELARALNIPEEVIQKKPSAGLTSGQTDEEDLGFTYEYLDDKLKDESWTDSDIDKEILKRNINTRHKRKMPVKFSK